MKESAADFPATMDKSAADLPPMIKINVADTKREHG